MKEIESVISSHGFEELFAVSLHTRERNTVLHNVQSCNRRRAAEWSRVHDCVWKAKQGHRSFYETRLHGERRSRSYIVCFSMGESCFVVISKFYRRVRPCIMKLPLVRNSSSGRNFRGWRYCERRVKLDL